MELDDLRQRWRQPADTSPTPAFNDTNLAEVLARGSRNPVAKMRRNVWLEIGFMLVCLVGSCGALFYTRDILSRAMLLWIIVICVLSGFYYRRKLDVIHQLTDTAAALREHIAQQVSGLRSLVRLYFNATMWSVPISLGMGLLILGGRIVNEQHGDKRLASLGILLAVYAIAGGGTYWFVRRFTHWYLQRLYGQHLDRLEAVLRELGA